MPGSFHSKLFSLTNTIVADNTITNGAGDGGIIAEYTLQQSMDLPGFISNITVANNTAEGRDPGYWGIRWHLMPGRMLRNS